VVLPGLQGRRRGRSAFAATITCVGLLAAQSTVSATPAVAANKQTPAPIPGAALPSVAGLSPLMNGTAEPAKPLPTYFGNGVALQRDLKIRAGSTPSTTASRSAIAADSPTALAAAATTDKAALRALVIAVDANDFGVATWTTTLSRVGAAYDVMYSASTPLTADKLVGPTGVGRYNAILLTNSTQLYQNSTGAYVSGLDGVEWNTLWAYERDYGVRQATLYSSYGTFPEDYCTRARSEGSVGSTPLNATLTATGATMFDYLKSSIQVPIVESYVYRTSIAAGCNATSVLANGQNVLGVRTTSTDGRERVALTFTSNQYLMQSNLLVYGMFRWASRGLYLGEQRHYLNIDVDDWFNSADHLRTDGTIETDPGFSMRASDAYNVSQRQIALRSQYPLASQFKMGMAYNAADANLAAGSTCSPNGGIAQLTATTKCLKAQFNWINHTATHPKLNFTDYATSKNEITSNLTMAQTLGLTVDPTVLKTGEYSGLGVYHPDPNDDLSPPTDYGLMASNAAMLQAAKDAGVKYLHGNMSFASHQPACFNCGIAHPMQPSLMIVPDWPTNIAYHVTTAAEETLFYNSFYGPNGRFPYWATNLTYAQLLDYEATVGLGHVASGSIYSHTFHIANMRNYSGGKTLTTDWAGAVMAKYSAYYNVPLLTPGWPGIATYAEARNAHFAGIAGGVEAVYDRVAKTVTVTSPAGQSGTASTVTVSGATTAGFTSYGTERSARITVPAGGSVSFVPTVRV
jgi:hypothetical protein